MYRLYIHMGQLNAFPISKKMSWNLTSKWPSYGQVTTHRTLSATWTNGGSNESRCLASQRGASKPGHGSNSCRLGISGFIPAEEWTAQVGRPSATYFSEVQVLLPDPLQTSWRFLFSPYPIPFETDVYGPNHFRFVKFKRVKMGSV